MFAMSCMGFGNYEDAVVAREDKVFYPEMGETTDAEIVYSVSHTGKYYVTTDLELSGWGIKKAGTRSYYVTERVLNKLKKEHSVAYRAML